MKKINHKVIRINKPIPPELKQAIEAKNEYRRKRKQELIRKIHSGEINFTEVECSRTIDLSQPPEDKPPTIEVGRSYQTNIGRKVVITQDRGGYFIGRMCHDQKCRFIPFDLNGVSWTKEIKLIL